MESMSRERGLFVFLNSIEIFGVLLVLFLASIFQFLDHELPCPLCLLQRAGFIAISTGLLFNLRFGPRSAHYSLVLLSALLTALIALRQIALHIVPGTGHYGNPVFGFHLYTWVFIISLCVLVYTAIILAFDVQYEKIQSKMTTRKTFMHFCFILVLAMTAINVVSVFVECGWKQCPDNPTRYLEI